MKNTKFLLFACIVCLLAVACKKDENVLEKTLDKFIMGETGFVSDDNSKVALQYSANKLIYEVDDIIKVNGETFSLSKSGSGSSTQWFANGNPISAESFYCAYADGVATTLSNFSGSSYHFNLAGRLSSATNKILLGGVTENNVLTLRPACAIIRLDINDSYSNVKVGFEKNKVLKEGSLNISSSDVTVSGTTYMKGVDQFALSADFLSMEYNTEEGYWYVAVPVPSTSTPVTTKLYFYWVLGGNADGKVTSGQVTLRQGYVYTLGAGGSSQAPFTVKGASTGLFNVAAGRQVRISAGNLQTMRTINPETGNYTFKWKFADHQYDYKGSSNGTAIQNNDADFDLFGYGTSGYNGGYNARFPNSTSSTASDYIATSIAGTSHDWGRYIHSNTNYKIYYGSAEVSSENWRTLTKEEWNYLISRTNKTGLATVAGQPGLLLLPDYFPGGWELPDGLDFHHTFNNYSTDVYSASEWDRLESAGAIFLPVTGYRNGTVVNAVTEGYYWSTSVYEIGGGRPNVGVALKITSSSVTMSNTNRTYGCAVRLVVEVEDE